MLYNKKDFWLLLWLITIIIGAITRQYIPEVWQYDYGFTFGAISFAALRLSMED